MFSVKVVGLDEFIDDLHGTASNPRGVMRPKDSAVISRWRAAVEGSPSNRQRARSIRSNVYRPTADGVEAVIGGGGGDRRWAAGAQFGSTISPSKGFAGPKPLGYTVGPAAERDAEQIAGPWADAIVDSIDK